MCVFVFILYVFYCMFVGSTLEFYWSFGRFIRPYTKCTLSWPRSSFKGNSFWAHTCDWRAWSWVLICYRGRGVSSEKVAFNTNLAFYSNQILKIHLRDCRRILPLLLSKFKRNEKREKKLIRLSKFAYY